MVERPATKDSRSKDRGGDNIAYIVIHAGLKEAKVLKDLLQGLWVSQQGISKQVEVTIDGENRIEEDRTIHLKGVDAK